MTTDINCNCEICGINYTKPENFKIWNDIRPNTFFTWNLKYCDICRRAKEVEALKSLPAIINALTQKK